MEEEKPRKYRRRVCAFEPKELVYASFPSNYISRLLPALARVTGIASCQENKDEDMEKTVRFEVDMALATSTSNCFKWSSVLKHQLQQQQQQQEGKFGSKTLIIPNPNPRKGLREHDNNNNNNNNNRKKNRGEEELEFRVRALRKIVPGGEEMNACELLTEMESYVVCLQMQVYILKSLVANH